MPCADPAPECSARKCRDRPLTFLALTDEDDPPLIRRFLDETPIDGLVGIDRRSETFRQYGIGARPTTVLVDASGIVRAVLTAEDLDEERLELLVAGRPIPTKNIYEAPPKEPGGSEPDSILDLRIRPALPPSLSGYSPGFMAKKDKTLLGWGLDLRRLAAIAHGIPEERIEVPEDLADARYDLSLTTPRGSFGESAGLLRQAIRDASDVRVTSEMRPTEV